MDQQLHRFEEKVQILDDQNLVKQVGYLFYREKRIGDAILLGIEEIKTRRIYAAMGYSSLFEMLVKYSHLSETASYQRVNALKLMGAVSEAQEALFNGDSVYQMQPWCSRSFNALKKTPSVQWALKLKKKSLNPLREKPTKRRK